MPDLKKLKRRKIHHEIENPDAPSGYVRLYNYKEPFMKFDGGFGFQGVLMFDGDTDKIQCHLCGVWSDYLPNHLQREHAMSASDYKDKVGLRPTTALIGEKLREKYISSGMEIRLKNLKSRKGTKMSKESIARRTESYKRGIRERQNAQGTCPAQLLARLQNEYQRLGVTPIHNNAGSKVKYSGAKYTKEMLESSKRIGSEETYIRVFGSWKNALEMANIPYRKPGTNVSYKNKIIWDEEKTLDWVVSFIDANGRDPKYREMPNAMYKRVSNKKLDKKKIFEEAWLKTRNTKGARGTRYSKKVLLKFLKNFKEIHGRAPSYSDAKRGLIPNLSRYSYHFGSWKKALKLSFSNE